MYPAYNIPLDTEEMKTCVLGAQVDDRLKKYSVDNLEETKKPASYYVGSTLVAKSPVNIYRLPSETSEVIKKYPKGSNVGVIYSYVTRDGQVWWQVNWFSGKHQGYAKAEKGLFDSGVALETSSGKQIEDKKAAEKAEEDASIINQLGKGVSGVAEGFGSIGANFKYILLAALVLVAVYFFLQFKKTL